MDEYIKLIHDAKPGQIVPIVKEIDINCPVEYFAKLSDYGQKTNCCLFESREMLTEDETGTLTFGTANPALYLVGTGGQFTIKALTDTGRRMLKYLAEDKNRFDFCKSIDFGQDAITGTLNLTEETVDEESRLKTVNQMDVLRTAVPAGEPPDLDA